MSVPCWSIYSPSHCYVPLLLSPKLPCLNYFFSNLIKLNPSKYSYTFFFPGYTFFWGGGVRTQFLPILCLLHYNPFTFFTFTHLFLLHEISSSFFSNFIIFQISAKLFLMSPAQGIGSVLSSMTSATKLYSCVIIFGG